MIVSDAQLEWVRRPLQARSQQTLERFLDAAEAIIEEQGIEALTVADVARRAGSSVGAFYSRFSDKEGLLRCVFERFNEQAMATSEAALAPARWDGIAVEDVLETAAGFMIHILAEKRGLLLALLTRTPGDPALAALGQQLHERITRSLIELVQHRGIAIDHGEPEQAIGLAVWMVISALEVRMLYASAGVQRHDDATVAAELTRMVMRYLGIARGQESAPAPRSRRRAAAAGATTSSSRRSASRPATLSRK